MILFKHFAVIASAFGLSLILASTNLPAAEKDNQPLGKASAKKASEKSSTATASAKPAVATELPKAFINGEGPGWVELGEKDFVNVNCDPETWTFGSAASKGLIRCTGKPVGVMRTKKKYTNFELVVEWRHLKSGGNSGVFVWTTEESLKPLKPNQLPRGIEVQILDHGYAEQYEKVHKKKSDWFTTNGDVFPVGSKMTPFPPTSANKSRSFPRKNLSKGVNQWNHYYIRGINGEVRLWVNGEEVSGGTGCDPKTGYLCLESEGAPIEFRNFRVRELP